MKKKLLIFAVLAGLVLLSGCGVYGGGETQGYITTVEDGIVWDRVYFRADLQSSQTDCYIINDDSLKERLKRTSINKERISMKYDRHLVTWGCTNDEAKGYTFAKGK